MRTIYNDQHRLHISPGEFEFGQFVPAFEKPERLEIVLRRLREVGLGRPSIRRNLFRSTASPPFTLPRCSRSWARPMRSGPHCIVQGLRIPSRGRAAACAATGREAAWTPSWRATASTRQPRITATTWLAAVASANCALSAAELITKAEDGQAFALCRPPGHHAGIDSYGGYCFLNNAAVAAQYLRDSGARKIAIIDVDYHHGNGTQNIFYSRADVFYTSIHADPDFEYPFLAGYADETGAGAGEGANLNLPLPDATGWEPWAHAMDQALAAIRRFAAEALIVSLGVDTFKGDPISRFRLESEHFFRIGERIASLKLATLFVMEGGYAIDEIGINTVNVLQGFEGA